jgi:asparagine synthase (glutamine-hydrolysing)
MCGIAGVIRVHEPGDAPPPPPLESIPESWLDVLDDSIKHRGPDGEGRFRDRAVREDGTVVDVALVHRRLSIIDLEDGAQPMIHDGERLRPDLVYHRGDTPIVASEVEPERPVVGVVFNGCIYNHRALRAELEGKGYVFGTDHSDTEVLVHGWREWGEGEGQNSKLQGRLKSMHAACVWDRNHGWLHLLRDTFGEKPLYFAPLGARRPGLIVFSSVAGPLAEFDPEHTLPLIKTSSYRSWIRHGWRQSIGANEIGSITPWSDSRTEKDGSPAENSDGLSAWIEHPGLGDPLTTARTEQLLRDAVRARVEADVPLGCFLSGGIDSSLICAFAREFNPAIRAFTVRMPVDRYDESVHAQAAADVLGIHLDVLDCRLNPAEDLVALIETLGLPFGDSSLLPTYWVCDAASRHIRVALSGDGGDELFYGYERHMIGAVAERYWLLGHLIPGSLIPDRDPKSRVSKARRLIEAMRSGRGSFAAELAAIFPRSDLRRLIGKHDSRIPDSLGALKIGSCSTRIWDLDNYLRGDLLRKTDTASMHVPIEVRCPFLDHDLARAAILSPRNALTPGGERKGLLKQVARKYLPDHIVDRPKQGFAIPIGEWFRSDYGSMRQLMLDHLRSSDPFPGLGEAGVEINMRFVERMIREHDAAGEKSINPWHGRDHSQRLYMLVVLSIWCKWLARVRNEKPAPDAG